MNWEKINKKCWFVKFKKNELDLNPVNRIENAKFNFEKSVSLLQWIIGIGLVAFLSVNLSNIQGDFIMILSSRIYVVSAILLLISIFLLIITVNRQKIMMAYLYQLKEELNKFGVE